MKSSRNSVFNNNVYDGLFFDEDEKRVSEILLDLPCIIYESEWRRRFPSLYWGNKRRRSALDDSPTTRTRTTTTTTSPPSTSCRQPEKERCVLKVKKNKVEKAVFAAACPAAAAVATSPSTPLSFSPSESDEHKSSKQSIKLNSKKRRKEELLEIIEGLNHNKEMLKGELDTLRNKHSKLRATNLELKSKKQELSSGQKTEKNTQLGMNGLYIEHYQYQMTKFAPQKYVMEPQLYGQKTPTGSSPYHGMRLVNQSPRGIPDLNICLEETCVLGASSQPLDLMMSKMMMDNNSRVRATAEARRRRMMKIKEVKNQGRSQSQLHPGH